MFLVGEVSKRAHITVGSASEVSLEISETDDGSLSATMTSPTGSDVPCIIRRLDDGHLGKLTVYILVSLEESRTPVLEF